MSFGFQVRDMASTSSNGDVRSILSESEGFRSAQATPIASIRRGYGDSEYRPGSTISADSASFHTPDSYESEDEHVNVNLSLDIPDFEAVPPSTYDIQTTLSDTYVPEQLPKLELRDEEEVGRADMDVSKDGPLRNEYKNEQYHRVSGQSLSNQQSSERTPLLPSGFSTDSDKTSCCLIL